MAAKPTFKATINGGIPLGRAGALPDVILRARPELRHGRAVYVRRSDAWHIVVTFRGFPPEATAHNYLGARIDLPDWVEKALRIINT